MLSMQNTILFTFVHV